VRQHLPPEFGLATQREAFTLIGPRIPLTLA
jgi:hypothetical protein